MLDFDKISEEHKILFPRGDLDSQLTKLDEEKSEAREAYKNYIEELADVLIVCAGIYRHNHVLADLQIERVYRTIDAMGMTDDVEDEVIRKWNINKSRKWEWNGKTYKHVKDKSEG